MPGCLRDTYEQNKEVIDRTRQTIGDIFSIGRKIGDIAKTILCLLKPSACPNAELLKESLQDPWPNPYGVDGLMGISERRDGFYDD